MLDSKISEIGRRVETKLREYGAMPFHALLYRLGETSSRRIEERALKRALTELVDNTRPRSGRIAVSRISAPRHGVFAERNPGAETATGLALETESKAVEIAENIEVGREDVVRSLCATIRAEIEQAEDWPVAEHVAGIRSVQRQLIFLRTDPKYAKCRILVAPDVGWVYPDDPRIWRLIRKCASEGMRAMVVARKIAPGCFPLFKAVGVTGLQYYAGIVPKQNSEALQAVADTIGWSHIRAADDIRMNAAWSMVRDTVDRGGAPIDQTLLPEGASWNDDPPSAGELIAWWRSSGIPPSHHVWERWAEWDEWHSYKRRRKAASNGNEVRVVAESLSGEANDQAEHRRDGQQAQPTRVVRIGLKLSIDEWYRVQNSAGVSIDKNSNESLRRSDDR